MFDRPPLLDRQIVDVLAERYRLAIGRLEFLALGHDANAWTFRAASTEGRAWFLKIRRHVNPARLALARSVQDRGIDAVVAPVAAANGALSVAIDGLHLVVYPFIDGAVAADVGLTDGQWIDYGRVAAGLHATKLTSHIEAGLPREQFTPPWTDSIVRLEARIAAYDGDDPVRGELVASWRSHEAEIAGLVRRSGELGRKLREGLERPGGRGAFVPCHADFHTHNLLVEPSGELRLVDWDGAMLAPRERDLMFVMGSPIGLAPGARELALFRRGYGELDVDPNTLAYYHLDWAVQDVSGYASQVMLDDIGPASRAYAFRIFVGLFSPGDEVEVARRLDPGAQGPS
jgi:spectinomycin phosphotransferase